MNHLIQLLKTIFAIVGTIAVLVFIGGITGLFGVGALICGIFLGLYCWFDSQDE